MEIIQSLRYAQNENVPTNICMPTSSNTKRDCILADPTGTDEREEAYRISHFSFSFTVLLPSGVHHGDSGSQGSRGLGKEEAEEEEEP